MDILSRLALAHLRKTLSVSRWAERSQTLSVARRVERSQKTLDLRCTMTWLTWRRNNKVTYLESFSPFHYYDMWSYVAHMLSHMHICPPKHLTYHYMTNMHLCGLCFYAVQLCRYVVDYVVTYQLDQGNANSILQWFFMNLQVPTFVSSNDYLVLANLTCFQIDDCWFPSTISKK